MSDTTPPGTRQDTDTTDDRPGLTVAEAARVLGITPDAVRAKIRRGTLTAHKAADDTWRVRLPTDTTATDQGRDTIGQASAPGTAGSEALIAQLHSENAYLREQLAAAMRQLADERERADVLHREALTRVEALTAVVRSEADTDSSMPASDTATPPAGVWRRLGRWLRSGELDH